MASSDESVLIIAYDGLDMERIREYECETLLGMSEFDSIDNSTNISAIKTSELFASFITGETHRVHNVKGLIKKHDDLKARIVQKMDDEQYREKIPGWITFVERIKSVTSHETEFYTKTDIETSTAFEIVENSKAMFVPSYNTSIFTRVNASLSILESGYSFTFEDYIELVDREFEYRKNRLLEDLEAETRALTMCHFHKIDLLQHLEQEEHSDIMEREYQKIDKLSENIIKRSDYDTIIFMSDHGVPTKKSHNKNAFYASNKELFGKNKPHITDFFSIMVFEKEKESIEGIDF